MYVPRRIDLERLQEYPGRIRACAEALRRRYKVHRIILFGSFAKRDLRVNVHELSDIDLVVIGDIPGEFAARAVALRQMTDLPIEPWVYTPSEWSRMVRQRRAFVEEVLETGVDL